MMKTIVISEIGENHYGRWDVCRGMVEESAANGATIAKFQAYTAEQWGKDHEAYEWFKGVEMPEKVNFEMQELCKQKGIGFLSSPFTARAATFLVEKMGLDAVKIPSGRIIHHDLLNCVNNMADRVKTVYMSVGGSSLDEINAAVKCLDKIDKLYLLHCVSQYPTDDENVNLRAMLALKEKFPQHGIGFSDHSRGIEACVAAVTLGAEVVEKHFSYSAKMPGDDHPGAMTPETLAEMVYRIKRVEKMFGSSEIKLLDVEKGVINDLRATLNELDYE
jgi:N,N'-diacetyllegionaminate synthase